jgi:regulator of replication initiation timing
LDRSNKEKNDFFKRITELSEQSADLKYDNKSLAKQVEDKVEEVKALKMKLELLDNKT